MIWKYEEKKDRNGKIAGESWTINNGKGVSATIVKGHIYHKNGYVLHCYPMGIDTRVLTGNTIEEIIDCAEKELSDSAENLINKIIDFVNRKE